MRIVARPRGWRVSEIRKKQILISNNAWAISKNCLNPRKRESEHELLLQSNKAGNSAGSSSFGPDAPDKKRVIRKSIFAEYRSIKSQMDYII